MTPYEGLQEVVRQCVKLGIILSGEVRLSLVNRGRELRVWVGGDQIIDGKRVKMAPLCHPKTGEKLVAAEPMFGGMIEKPFQEACARLICLILAAYMPYLEERNNGKASIGSGSDHLEPDTNDLQVAGSGLQAGAVL